MVVREYVLQVFFRGGLSGPYRGGKSGADNPATYGADNPPGCFGVGSGVSPQTLLRSCVWEAVKRGADNPAPSRADYPACAATSAIFN